MISASMVEVAVLAEVWMTNRLDIRQLKWHSPYNCAHTRGHCCPHNRRDWWNRHQGRHQFWWLP
jgi:hypothetical protein